MSLLRCVISMVGEVGERGLLTHFGGDMESMEKHFSPQF